MRLEYVGCKPSKTDNLYGTGTWFPDEPRDVADDVAARMLKHPDVWAEAKPAAPAPASLGLSDALPPVEVKPSQVAALEELAGQDVVDTPPAAPADADLEALRATCRSLGLKVHHKNSAETLAALIAEHNAKA